MRAERRREIEAQLAQTKKEIRGNRINKFTRTVSIIYTIILIAFVVMLFKLDMIPEKYFYPGLLVLGVISLFMIPCMFSKRGKKGRKIFSSILAIALIGVFGVGTYYLTSTMDFVEQITTVTEETEDYYVVVREDSAYQEIGDIAGLYVATTINNDMKLAEAKAEVQEAVSVEYQLCDSDQAALESLSAGTYEACLISAAAYDAASNEDSTATDGTRILYTVKLKIETSDSTSTVNVTKEAFNVYISGSDFQGSFQDAKARSDVNMIATINPETHRVVLTSIPRDYFVTLSSKDATDKLTHSSLYGIQETISTVEDTLGVEINYYVRVNFTTVMKLVDALGGIDVESDYDFYTSGMKGMPELNGLHFVKGTNHMTGAQALAFCRERHSFAAGDMVRNENQQRVMEAILKKMTSSSAILTKYTSLLQAIEENMVTNMTQDDISKLVKTQLNKMPSWDIERQSIKGDTGSGYCYTLGCYASVVYQNAEANAVVLDEIVKVMDGAEAGTEENSSDNEE